ncbi:hypothetical protein V495_00402 [Pseudogymnoascus sp. VKM F-4514 (FW-929)]|nr:hypothetical protein V495_00402 [Pseudogymnoascus sp. VKM F-4514 (FW-929)]KFY66733.1 hypothetical protein V497_00753 [Pseudogymnoascus sp. VKM F-4516 (FW-969)]
MRFVWCPPQSTALRQYEEFYGRSTGIDTGLVFTRAVLNEAQTQTETAISKAQIQLNRESKATAYTLTAHNLTATLSSVLLDTDPTPSNFSYATTSITSSVAVRTAPILAVAMLPLIFILP